jgi:hypothetical protein
MMQTYGVTYQTAGENIAGNPSVTGAFQAWMNSPGHRANILNGPCRSCCGRVSVTFSSFGGHISDGQFQIRQER